MTPVPPTRREEFDDVVPADLPPAQLTENARIVLAKRYLKKDDKGQPTEEPETMFWRVAKVIADVDKSYGASEAAVEEVARQFYDLMTTGQFEPNSPTLMNAGRPLGQLSACFVLPVEDALSNGESGIYDTLKSMALVHQSGGGCVAGDAHVCTTFCGVEEIRTLYERVRATGIWEEQRDGHRIMDVASLGMRTLALDSATGRFEAKPVTHLWQWDVPAEQQMTIRCEDGSEVTTSAWHPFMVFTPAGVVERRSDELVPGDLLLTANRSARSAWPIETYKDIEGFRVDEDLAWLVGYALGDGCVGRFRNVAESDTVLRFTDLRPQGIEFAARVLARHGVEAEPYLDVRGCWSLAASDYGFVPRFARLAGLDAFRDAVTMPEWVAKSPLSVIGAFLAGLIDSDGSVSTDQSQVEIATVSPRLARKLMSLTSALGLSPSSSEKQAIGKACKVEHRVRLASARKIAALADLVADGLRDPFKRERILQLHANAQQKQDDRIPLPFTTMGADLKALGELVDGDWAVVTEVSQAAEAKPFYDFTVAGHNTYLAGGGAGKMLVIHNTGFSFSRIRPTNDTVRSTMGIASGPVSFMKLYDASTEVVKQGSFRRGANMGILRVDHPDIREFITCKNDTSQVTNFNISVAITDAFMKAVKQGTTYDLVSPRSKKVVGHENAREIFDMIVEGAWMTGEPGVFFIDRANEYNPVPKVMEYEATNPCGEQPLGPYDVCNLGSINLGPFVREDAAPSAAAEERVDWEGLRHVVHLSTHFLDNVIDANAYPLKEIDELAQNIRRIGLGVMGWADMLVRLGIPYDSEAGVDMARRVMEFVNEESRNASEKLAEGRGTFPAWKDSIWGPDKSAARRPDGSRVRSPRKLRNCNLTTVAPTGTISIFAGCSGGIEPLFAVAFMRNQAGALMPDVNPDFVRVAREQGWYSDELMERIATEGHIHFEEVPVQVQRVFRTAHDITPEWHVRMQAAYQEHVDSAISKTTNFATEASREDVRAIYELAYDLNCKGVTVYRDGCRPNQVLSTGKTGKTEATVEEQTELADAREEIHRLEGDLVETKAKLEERDRMAAAARHKRQRPTMLRGRTMKMNSPLGDIYVTINEDEQGRPFELFCSLGKAGGAAMADAEAIGRLVSLALRSGVPITSLRDQLRGISCDRPVGIGPNKVLSAPDAIGIAIERYLEEVAGVQEPLPFEVPVKAPEGTAVRAKSSGAGQDNYLGSCPECSTGSLAYEEGCVKCHICGYSECG